MGLRLGEFIRRDFCVELFLRTGSSHECPGRHFRRDAVEQTASDEPLSVPNYDSRHRISELKLCFHHQRPVRRDREPG